jgi:integrase
MAASSPIIRANLPSSGSAAMSQDALPSQEKVGSWCATHCGPAQNAAITVRDVALMYLRAGGESRFVWQLIDDLGGKPLSEITQEFIDWYAAGRHARASTAIRQCYVPLAAILHSAAARGLCQYRQIKRPHIPTEPRVRWIWPAESAQLAAQSWPHFRPLYVFLQHTGSSPKEALSLDWQDVNLGRREIEFRETPQAEGRTLPLHPQAAAALSLLSNRHGPVFRRMDDEPYKATTRAAAGIKTAFTNACARAGIKNFTLRDVRTTYCIWRLAVDRDADLLYELGGRDERMIAKYRHVSATDLNLLRTALEERGADTKQWPLETQSTPPHAARETSAETPDRDAGT